MPSTKRVKNSTKSVGYRLSPMVNLRLLMTFLSFMLLIRESIAVAATEANSTDLNELFEHYNSSLIALPPPYQTYRARDISSIPAVCKPKGEGKSRGRICELGGSSYYLKIETPEFAHFREFYHNSFVANNIGAVVPNCNYAADGNQRFYIACQELTNFTLAKNLQTADCNRTQFRNNLIAAVGEQEVPKLLTAQFFIFDLWKLPNWGVVNNKIAFVDVDGSDYVQATLTESRERIRNQPKSIEEYLQLTFETLRFKQYPGGQPRLDHMGIALSLRNILDMRNLFARMLFISSYHHHDKISMPASQYELLLNIFIYAIDKTLNIYENVTLSNERNVASDDVNHKFADNIEMVRNQLSNYTLDHFKKHNKVSEYNSDFKNNLPFPQPAVFFETSFLISSASFSVLMVLVAILNRRNYRNSCSFFQSQNSNDKFTVVIPMEDISASVISPKISI